jgi:hypothetical protein
MMAIAIRFEKAMPTSVSRRMRRNWRGAERGERLRGLAGVVATSSASCELCQKKR